MVDRALFTSDSDEWETPQAFYDLLDTEFHFTLDPCATAENAKCKKFYTKEQDGLRALWWVHTVFVNPPYSQIKEWVRKCYEEAQSGAAVVMLIPSRTDTRYWHDYVMKAAEIRFVRGRLKFAGAKNSAPFPSAVVVFRQGYRGTPHAVSQERK